ncbi:general transcription factor II-I repeat domain-containing protein 2A-like [Zootermopsis nevadensis]|uniref:general transcription factor II-I repeat domain-containing protein 2A-like n=1 Tax=Zootermopsis nevadensis TaxID=136037 RepID=UPI000B8E6ED1|nr:general transcription factor II-I repeat domain-containing protein 2A-like [Zootermopsis nevadensis]
MQTQLKSGLELCDWFSLQFDESTDVSDTAQLAIMVRMVFSDFSVKEELLKVLPIKRQTKGENIYNTFKTYAMEITLPLHKLSAIATDVVPGMLGSVNGFIALCKKDESFPDLLPFGHVMNVVKKIINSIRAAPLQHRLFKALLGEFEGKHSDLILYTEVRWLSKGKVLARFLSLIEEIKDFLKSKNADFNELSDPCWLLDLGFLTDVTDKAYSLNLELWGKEKRGSNDRLCKINQSKTSLVDVTYEDEVSRTLPKYEENGRG